MLTLGAFLGIRAEREEFPTLIYDRSDFQQHQYVYRHFAGPANLSEWRQQLGSIRAFLGDAFEWTVSQDDATHVRLHRHTPLPRRLAFEPSNFKPGNLFVGVDTISREPLQVPLEELTHVLLCGASGTGKSNALHVICQSVFANLDLFEQVYLVDGKEGVAFNRYRDTDPGKVKIIWEQSAFAALIDSLGATMDARNHAQRDAGVDNATEGFIAVIIDELAAFIEPPSNPADRAAHKALLVGLQKLARRGRSVGIRLIVTVQDPTEENLPTTVRSQLQSVLAFRLAIPQHVSAVFGDQAELPVKVRDLPVGRAIYQNKATGTTAVVQLPVIGRPS